jgi:hypothetical protein
MLAMSIGLPTSARLDPIANVLLSSEDPRHRNFLLDGNFSQAAALFPMLLRPDLRYEGSRDISEAHQRASPAVRSVLLEKVL